MKNKTNLTGLAHIFPPRRLRFQGFVAPSQTLGLRQPNFSHLLGQQRQPAKHHALARQPETPKLFFSNTPGSVDAAPLFLYQLIITQYYDL